MTCSPPAKRNILRRSVSKKTCPGLKKIRIQIKAKKTIAKSINLDFALHLNHQIEVQKLTFMVNLPSIRITASLSTMGGGGGAGYVYLRTTKIWIFLIMPLYRKMNLKATLKRMLMSLSENVQRGFLKSRTSSLLVCSRGHPCSHNPSNLCFLSMRSTTVQQ